MKIRRTADATEGTREEVRELAEAVSLYRSAMHHLAEREAARPRLPEPRPARTRPLRLLLAPVLAAAVAAGVLVPVYGHFHHAGANAGSAESMAAQTSPTAPHSHLDDTALMNQIDTQVSEEVPDALQPLLDPDAPASTTTSEKNHVTQE